MAGYYNDPEATELALRGGWFYSGDAAVVHPDGYVEIRDRLKDVIISGGENISSVEVEGVLLKTSRRCRKLRSSGYRTNAGARRRTLLSCSREARNRRARITRVRAGEPRPFQGAAQRRPSSRNFPRPRPARFRNTFCEPDTAPSLLSRPASKLSARRLLRAVFVTVLLLLALFVLVPAAGALFSEPSLLSRAATRPAFSVGAPIIHRREEVSARPTADARDIRPAEHGEYYYYSIINYLRVIEVLGDGRIIAVARNQQRLCFWPDDLSLRKARLTERLIYRLRFSRA